MSTWIEHGVKGRSWGVHKYVSRNNGKYVYSSEDRKRYREAAAKVRTNALDSVNKIKEKHKKQLYGKKLEKAVSSSFLNELIKEADKKSKREQSEMITNTNAAEFLIRAFGYRSVGKKYKTQRTLRKG